MVATWWGLEKHSATGLGLARAMQDTTWGRSRRLLRMIFQVVPEHTHTHIHTHQYKFYISKVPKKELCA